MPRSATVRVLHSLLVFSSCRWYQNKSSHFFLLCQHFSMLNCSRPNVHRFQSSDAGGGILCGARSNHGGLQVFVINYHSLTFILKAFIIFIAGWERCSSLQWQSLACACTRLKNIIKTSKYHHLLLPAGHPGPRAHSWPLRPFPISSKFIQPILTKNWPSCCCKLNLYFKRKPLSRRSTQTFTRAAGSWPSSPPPSFSRLPAGQNCIVFHFFLVFGWNMIMVLVLVMVMVVLWVTVVYFFSCWEILMVPVSVWVAIISMMMLTWKDNV